MDQRLFAAAKTGNISALHELLNEDPLILEKVYLSPSAETPLHVATLSGQTEFAKEMINLMASFAMEPNRDGFTALHMASARGDIDLVKELLMLTDSRNRQCLIKDNAGRIPLHYAVIRGRIPVIEELISHCPQSLQEITALGETVLHLAVKNSQFGALKVLLDRLEKLECLELETRSNESKILFQLAEATGHVQVLQLLKEYHVASAENGQIEYNVSTETPANEVHIINHMSPGPKVDVVDNKNKERQHETKEVKTKPNEAEMHNLMLVAAVLIATVTYQAGLSPPPSIWNDGVNHMKCNIKINLLKGTGQCPRYYFFMIFNTGGFFLATAVMLWITWSYSNKAIKLLGTSILMLLCNYIGQLINLSPDLRNPGFVLLPLPFVVATLYCIDLAIRSLLKLRMVRIERQRC